MTDLQDVPGEAPILSPPMQVTGVTEININDVIVQNSLYPRFIPNEKLIERYADNIDELPPIVVNQHNILVDGYHRHAAYKMVGKTAIPVRVVYTDSDNDILLQAVMLNSYHGLQLSTDEKRHIARILSPSTEKALLSKSLGVSVRTIERWTSDERQVIEEERNKSIIELYMQCPTTQQEIAFKLGVDQSTVSRGIKTMQERHLSEMHNWFIPFSSTLWPTGLHEIDPLPQALVENLLYYHTRPLDLVFDPFAESTNTKNACIRMQRRYYCCDPLGFNDKLKQWNVSEEGLPPDLPIPDITYIDHKGGCTFELITNSELAKHIKSILDELIQRKIHRIALHVYPCELKGGNWGDPLMDLGWLTEFGYCIDRRYIIQYQQSDIPVQKDKVDPSGIDKVLRIEHSDLVVWVNKKFLP